MLELSRITAEGENNSPNVPEAVVRSDKNPELSVSKKSVCTNFYENYIVQIHDVLLTVSLIKCV